MKISGPGADADTKICAQCGRVGVRGFMVLPAGSVTLPGGAVQQLGAIILCANKTACRSRWPKPVEVDE